MHKTIPKEWLPFHLNEKSLFKIGSTVKHKSGNIYRILGFVTIEASLEQAYRYANIEMFDLEWIRPIKEMEDGRFVEVYFDDGELLEV
jgi:hypothetical protein